ncbi:hypothetical protein Tdes44962_MAKER04748 [Teratosphaeria destructans]|uniref:Uncharacterized protein n=1 Tax=Teratosphaeria destructans TaxID=418781 RepID=A0A9W7SLL2_9PEZI|nr:hypothetical protein Tdes44962_MAKER04748 [Teratosphaeria destructans]
MVRRMLMRRSARTREKSAEGGTGVGGVSWGGGGRRRRRRRRERGVVRRAEDGDDDHDDGAESHGGDSWGGGTKSVFPMPLDEMWTQ